MFIALVRHAFFTILFCTFFHNLTAQNCLGIKNMDVLNIAKNLDLTQLSYVTLDQKKLIASPEFKFVQLRDTDTFILVPDGFQGRVIDFKLLLAEDTSIDYVLDLRKMTVRIVPILGNSRQTCNYKRLSKAEISSLDCPDSKWTVVPPSIENAIIVPPYRRK
ncbi:MAG: hypothetical protein KDC53_19600 [Saprospiraceae bacterium]|nr:hypothetical protein [Saprospiraceae bacterium]